MSRKKKKWLKRDRKSDRIGYERFRGIHRELMNDLIKQGVIESNQYLNIEEIIAIFADASVEYSNREGFHVGAFFDQFLESRMFQAAVSEYIHRKQNPIEYFIETPRLVSFLLGCNIDSALKKTEMIESIQKESFSVMIPTTSTKLVKPFQFTVSTQGDRDRACENLLAFFQKKRGIDLNWQNNHVEADKKIRFSMAMHLQSSGEVNASIVRPDMMATLTDRESFREQVKRDIDEHNEEMSKVGLGLKDDITDHDVEMGLICHRFAFSLALYMSAFPQCVKDGPPEMLNTRSIGHVKMKRPVTITESEFVRSSPQAHWRSWHFRQLEADRFKRNADGTPRVVFVRACMVGAKQNVKTVAEIGKKNEAYTS